MATHQYTRSRYNSQGPRHVVVHVPQHDTLVFQGRRDTVVELLSDTGHCAVTRLPEVFSTIADWLTRTLMAAAQVPR